MMLQRAANGFRMPGAGFAGYELEFKMAEIKRVIIMGAAGRDFHNFNVRFRNHSGYKVEAFTAFQIPGIAGRYYPPELAGDAYPEGIPIFDERELPALIRRFSINEVVFSYSDVSHLEVMHRASLVNALGPDFVLLGSQSTMVESRKPVISVCAVRTGCGKSQTSRCIAGLLKEKGKAVVVVRHPMPYGADLNAQRVQRFQTLADLDKHHCTIEEREEYEAHIQRGHIVYAGVDYEDILHRAEEEADIILWDGGNNDLPFYRTDLHIVVTDAHRPGHEIRYYPGEANLRMAQVVLLNKAGNARAEWIAEVEANVRALNPEAVLIRANSVVTVPEPAAIRGKQVLVIEDGPTLTHGEMTYGAGHVAAQLFGAAGIVDPRPYAAGSIQQTYAKYRHLTDILPAMGYGDRQVQDLKTTIEAVPCDLVLVGTPVDLGRLIKSDRPMVRVSYGPDTPTIEALSRILDEFLSTSREGRKPYEKGLLIHSRLVH
jgi:predicted GTPase